MDVFFQGSKSLCLSGRYGEAHYLEVGDIFVQGKLQAGPHGWKASCGTPHPQSYIIGVYGNVDTMPEVCGDCRRERRQRQVEMEGAQDGSLRHPGTDHPWGAHSLCHPYTKGAPSGKGRDETPDTSRNPKIV
ncbi:hypothetical protein HPB49_012036 [Dermacentor silvarum]|uniref:Uncharacterized protein n=1 Tax=Dermacentor silvarum TaxID=543639 RepID=A0ACB8C3E4_DERSI|nr:hypothetical protein HPB49_012036 [Dermacentor silvarum]